MAFIVYGANLSPFVRKVRVALTEKGLEYQLEQVSPFAPPPEFLAISPLKRIPAFRDTDRPEPNSLADSSIICDYLEHKHPQKPLYPSDPYLRARTLWFEEYADSAVAQAVGAGLFFERVVKKIMRGQTDETICQATLKDKLPPLFDYLEKEIGTNQFLVGNTFTLADISVGTMFVTFLHCGETVNPSRWPQLAAYVKRLRERPSFKAMIEEETPLVQRLRAA
jgi:glutathione S-transferase